MRAYAWNRRVHYWLTFLVALPLPVIVASGILLQWKKQSAWIQPPEQRASQGTPTLSIPRILEICGKVPDAGIRTWDDVGRVDFRPGKNLVKVIGKNHWEIQMHAVEGRVLQSAYRRSDWIEEIHDGSFFHEHAKLWLFFPVSLGLLVLWLTGLWMFLRPLWKARMKKAGGNSPP